ncbi:MAG: GntR family transcriptional regulator [Oscillospiraceae bacterium]|nr:GntR family transcriptional regulator [Oscillospiraceae bacterium]
MISLNYRDPRPVYEQIKEKLRNLILAGGLGEGEKLPAVRELAGTLAINPNTIQRAYRELEAEGYIYTQLGKGSFVASLDQVGGDRKKQLLQTFTDTARELLHLGFTPTELSALLEENRRNEE